MARRLVLLALRLRFWHWDFSLVLDVPLVEEDVPAERVGEAEAVGPAVLAGPHELMKSDRFRDGA